MTTGARRRVALGLLIVGLLTSLIALSDASGAAKKTPPFQHMAGTWNIEAMSCPGTCGDTWILTRVSNDVYNMKDLKGFYAKHIVISPSGAAAPFKETCNGCTGWEIITLHFKSPANGRNTFSGVWTPYSPNGTAGGIGKISGAQVTGIHPDLKPSISKEWGPSKCKRAYNAWARQHPHATLGLKRAEASQLNKAHSCNLAVA